MKEKAIAIAALLAFGMTSVAQLNQGFVTANTVELKKLAERAIAERYPDTIGKPLDYGGMTIRVKTNDEVVIEVKYFDRGSQVLQRTETNRLVITDTRTETITVSLDGRGKIDKVVTGRDHETRQDKTSQ